MIVPMMEVVARMMMMKIASLTDVKNFQILSMGVSLRFASGFTGPPVRLYG